MKWSDVRVAQPCPTLCNPTDCGVRGILQERILEWVTLPFSSRSSQPRDWTQVSRIAGGSLPSEPHGKLCDPFWTNFWSACFGEGGAIVSCCGTFVERTVCPALNYFCTFVKPPWPHSRSLFQVLCLISLVCVSVPMPVSPSLAHGSRVVILEMGRPSPLILFFFTLL